MKLIKQWTTRLAAIIILSLSDTVFGGKASNATIFILHIVDFVKDFYKLTAESPTSCLTN